LQLITYIFALTKVVGQIMPHSITFFPAIVVFVFIQISSVLANDSPRFLLSINIVSSIGALALVLFGFHDMQEAISRTKKTNNVVASLYHKLSNDLDECGDSATIFSRPCKIHFQF
jgi:hypothetical protein